MAKARILVVDDEEGILKVCADTLRRLPDTEIILENQSRRAAERLSSESFDLLITDIRMPEVDGVELLQIARQHAPDLTAFMLTAFPAVETAVEGMKLGAVDYMIKPFHPHDLLATVRRLLAEKRFREQHRLLQKKEGMTEGYQAALDGLRQMIHLEMEGIRFFSRAAEITQDPKGKEVFRYLAHIEERHAQVLRAEHEALSQAGRWLSHREAHQARKGELLPQVILDSQEVLQQVQEGTGDLEALKIAFELEKKAYNAFREAADRVQDSMAQEVFQQLASEEETHLELFEAEYDNVIHSGFYFDIREFSPELQ